MLDARLALYHRRERWLAVADVHFGYELSQRAAGALFPMWGMDTIEARLRRCWTDYRPGRLIIVGRFRPRPRGARAGAGVAGTAAGDGRRVRGVLLAGNHDRRAFGAEESSRHGARTIFVSPRRRPRAGGSGRAQEIIGHHHPAATLRDGAGLALKLPAFVQGGTVGCCPRFRRGRPAGVGIGDAARGCGCAARNGFCRRKSREDDRRPDRAGRSWRIRPA